MLPSRGQSVALKKRKKSHSGLIILVCLIVVILIISGVGVVHVAKWVVSSSVDNSGVHAICSVAGNDFVVIIQEEDEHARLYSVELSLSGYTMPDGVRHRPVPENEPYPKKMVYEGMVAGMKGEIGVLIKGEFSDGTKKTIWTGNVKLS